MTYLNPDSDSQRLNCPLFTHVTTLTLRKTCELDPLLYISHMRKWAQRNAWSCTAKKQEGAASEARPAPSGVSLPRLEQTTARVISKEMEPFGAQPGNRNAFCLLSVAVVSECFEN